MQKLIAATTLTIGMALTGSALAQDAVAGKKVFKKCAACHKVGEKAKNSTGPILNNVLGRAAGSAEGYKYSKTLKAANAAGLIWDADKIAEYITDPKAYMKAFLDDPKAKPKMTFKLNKEQQRLDVVAYLSQFSVATETSGDAKPAAVNSDADKELVASKHIVSTEGKVCVENSTSTEHFFAAEVKGGMRVTGTLAAGEILCANEISPDTAGYVSVFETETHLEGCTRLVTAGKVEKLLKYADFDRCAWSSNSPS